MATDFWASSHYKRWIVDKTTVELARSQDLLYVEDPEYLDYFEIYFANLIAKLAKKLSLRQRVIATAIVFLRRFYVKNSYCETDPFIVVAACCYVAAKAEESPVHIKNVATEARLLFRSEEIGMTNFNDDHSKLAEMEFYLVDDLECDLIVFHPYRTLLALCGKEGQISVRDAEAGEMGVGIDDGPRFWGTGEGKLELQEGAVQMAWFIINDTYRSNICLMYPPHLIAIAALFVTVVFHSPTHAQLNSTSSSSASSSHSQSQPAKATPRRSTRPTNSTLKKQPQQDIVAFLAGLNVNLSHIATIIQEIISLYLRWEKYTEDSPDATRPAITNAGQLASSIPPLASSIPSRLVHSGNTSNAGNAASGSSGGNGGHPSSVGGASNSGRSASVHSSAGTTTSGGSTPPSDDSMAAIGRRVFLPPLERPEVVTPAFLTQVAVRMRETKMLDVMSEMRAHDRQLERIRAAG